MKKILVPVDGSPTAAKAAAEALDLAKNAAQTLR
jgi:nucleotide-binding universal stress UspA family protein